MLLTEKIKVKVSGKNIKRIKAVIPDVEAGDVVEVHPSVMPYSREELDVCCDYCGDLVKVQPSNYFKITADFEKYACKKKECKFGRRKEKVQLLYGGVDPSKEKRAKTNLERYGVIHTASLDSVIEKRKQTNLEKYGFEHAWSSKEVQEKIKQTNLERYGVECVLHKEGVQEKVKATNLEKYGVEFPFQNEEFKQRAQEILKEKLKDSEFVEEMTEKRKQTNLERYGVEHPLQSEEVKEKVKNTLIDRYGVDNISKLDEIKKLKEQKSLEKYGVPSTAQAEEVKQKMRETNLERYGVEYVTLSEEVQKKMKDTNLERYGVERIFALKEIQEKIKDTFQDKYGAKNFSQSDEYRKGRFNITKHPNYIRYNKEEKKSVFKCDRGEDHEFEMTYENFHGRTKGNIPLCTVCNPIGSSSSIKQTEVLEYIRSLTDLEVINNYRDGIEIDIYIPELKLGFEFNGLYWHSEEYKEPNYHAVKNKYFAEKGIRIIHIWEDEWDLKRDIICSQIQNLLGLSKKIYARNTKIQKINNKEAREFLEEHHLQGGYRGIQISYGLFHKDELISVMTFDSQEGRKQMPEDEYNLSRFCSKKGTAVIGGASKLLTAFCREQKPNRIISYADADWSNGGVYETLGFEKLSYSRPDYKYVVDGVREHKSKYRKPKGEQRTEREIMEELGIPRVYDSGKIKYELKTQTTQNGKKHKKDR